METAGLEIVQHLGIFNSSDLPQGFTAMTSLPQVTIPAGGTAEVGICLTPSTAVPAVVTMVAFNVGMTSTTQPQQAKLDEAASNVRESVSSPAPVNPQPTPVTTVRQINPANPVPTQAELRAPARRAAWLPCSRRSRASSR